MPKTSPLDRLIRLENQRHFLEWFALNRFYASLTLDELETYESDGKLPDPIPNRPSSLDQLDRKSLLRLWEEYKRKYGRRSPEELECYVKNGFWPEQRGRFHYSMQDGRLVVGWRIGPEEEGTGSGDVSKTTEETASDKP